MNDKPSSADPARIAGDIVIAFLHNNSVDHAQLPTLVREIVNALKSGDEPAGLAIPAAAGPPPIAETKTLRPAVPVEASVTPSYLISLEDGQPFRSLTRHLKAKHNLTPQQYRAKWGLPDDYPMVAPDYAAERSAIAKRTGLGGPVRKQSDPAPAERLGPSKRPSVSRKT